MKDHYNNILIIQTAFIGDAILTLPLIQVLKNSFSNSSIDVVAIPRTSEIFTSHPAVSRVIQYDKHARDKGIGGFVRLYGLLRSVQYDLVIVPHRSLRSALLSKISHAPFSIGFDRSAGRFLLHCLVHYDPTIHEVERNLSLLEPLGIKSELKILPRLYPSEQDIQYIDSIIDSLRLNNTQEVIAIAPGTVWNTKRWPKERFAEVSKRLIEQKYAVVLIGGKEDALLCEDVKTMAGGGCISNFAGKLSLLQSAEFIRRCKILISNDSAPAHLSMAVGTPVVAIFGATVPEFGFAPYGPEDIVVEIKGLECRPCSIHGGKKCPIKTFDCMMQISPQNVLAEALSLLTKKNASDPG